MSKPQRIHLLGIIAAAAAAVSCGSGAPTFTAGEAPNQQVNQLSDQQVQDVCGRIQSYFRDQVFSASQIQDAACTVAGITLQNTVPGETCSQFVKDCTSGSPTTAPTVIDCSTIDSTAVAGCSSTIGQLENCINEIGADVTGVYSQLTCSLADDPNWQTKLTDLAGQLQNTSCSELAAGCPFSTYGVTLPSN